MKKIWLIQNAQHPTLQKYPSYNKSVNILRQAWSTSQYQDAFARLTTACWRQICCNLWTDLLQVDCHPQACCKVFGLPCLTIVLRRQSPYKCFLKLLIYSCTTRKRSAYKVQPCSTPLQAKCWFLKLLSASLHKKYPTFYSVFILLWFM